METLRRAIRRLREYLLRELSTTAGPACPESTVQEAAYACLHSRVFARILDASGMASTAEHGFEARAEQREGTLPCFGAPELLKRLPVPPRVVAEVDRALREPSLDGYWDDELTLGWTLQLFNDPAREALDAKLKAGGKVEVHEIAPKTQLFTERYMAEWLLANSLGQLWLCICSRHGWRAALPTPEEGPWRYWVSQPIAPQAVSLAPRSLRELRLLDPACGAGHLLVVAFGLLFELYREEARQRGESWSDAQIVDWILHLNLHGIDIEPRAVQVAHAALWWVAKRRAPGHEVALPTLLTCTAGLGDPQEREGDLRRLTTRLQSDFGIAADSSRRLVDALRSLAHQGSLVRLDEAVSEALAARTSADGGERALQREGSLEPSQPACRDEGRAPAEAAVRERLAAVLAAFWNPTATAGERSPNPPEAAGTRLLSHLQAGRYHVVVGNPPYLGTQRARGLEGLDPCYVEGKEDLYGMFLQRGVELLAPGGIAAWVTMRSWMYVSHFAPLRRWLLREAPPVVLANLGSSSFACAPNVEAVMATFGRPLEQSHGTLLALDTLGERSASEHAAALASAKRRFRVSLSDLEGVPGAPVIYHFSQRFLREYRQARLLGEIAPVRVGMKTSNNARYLRRPWEVERARIPMLRVEEPPQTFCEGWVPYIKGAVGRRWFEPLSHVVLWDAAGLAIRISLEAQYGQGPQCESQYFRAGVAYNTIGKEFVARMHRYRSIFDVAGSSVFPQEPERIVCLLNAPSTARVVEALNPTINFQVGDVARIPLLSGPPIEGIVARLRESFNEHEARREPSVEFRSPGASSWRYTQDWAARAIDRPEGAPLPPYLPQWDPPAAESRLSFAVGVALGRFAPGLAHDPPPTDEERRSGLATVEAPPGLAPLASGILFLASESAVADSLDHPAAACLVEAWRGASADIPRATDLCTWLRKEFFAYHRAQYKNRPIYFPLSSARRSFVAIVTIHRWTAGTLRSLRADHLRPAREALAAAIAEAEANLKQGAKEVRRSTRKRRALLAGLLAELESFEATLADCAEKGPPATGDSCALRERDAPYEPVLKDGVRVNSSALWPLLAPQWPDPKRWWRELASGSGRKDCDWSRLAARYFPSRVARKCREDPSLAFAQGCLWRHFPATAYRWELQMQQALGPHFELEEGDAEERRRDYLRDAPRQAREIRARVERQRQRARPREPSLPPAGPSPVPGGTE